MTELEIQAPTPATGAPHRAVGNLPVAAGAIAAAPGGDYLLTWNCKPIANAYRRARIETVCRVLAFQSPVICTPV